MSRLAAMQQGSKAAGGFLASLGLGSPVLRESIRNSPIPESTKYLANRIDDSADKYLEELKPGAKLGYNVHENVPSGTVLERINQVIDDAGVYASSTAPGKQPAISINPNADRAMYAHEVGHLVSQQTDVGNLAAKLRHNPNLKKALLASMVTLPGMAAALEEGDDDYDTSLALAALSAAPTMIDEGLATTHGLGLLNKGGMRASIGQRGKLAGGLLSYMAAPIIAATAGNAAGNLMD